MLDRATLRHGGVLVVSLLSEEQGTAVATVSDLSAAQNPFEFSSISLHANRNEYLIYVQFNPEYWRNGNEWC